MRQVREVLRLKFTLGRTHRQIQAATGLSAGSVCEYLKRASAAGLTWEIAEPLSDGEVESRLFAHEDRSPAEVTRTQRLGDFVESIVRALEYFGGAPEVIVPDQLKSAVAGADWFDPELNPTIVELAAHYGTVIVPARPRKPKDKSKVEVGVQIVQRWILARLRNRTFFDINEINAAVAELIEVLNERPFQKLAGCRRGAFESIDRPALRPLPATRFVRTEWKRAKVHPDYHVAFDDRFYSAPCSLVGERIEIRATVNTVEILHDGVRVAAHARSYGAKGKAITLDAHKPASHRDYGQWPPERMRSWAETIGPSVRLVVDSMMARYPRPEMAYRAVFALTRDAKTYGHERLDAACARALALAGPWGPTRKGVLAILSRGLDRAPLRQSEAQPRLSIPAHDNVRGGAYFDKEEDRAD